MTPEEKAKRYDEAIKIAKEINNEQRAQPFNVMTRVFPELKESDEKIRKALIDGFTVMKESKNCGKTFSNHNIPVVDILAWLEKQGEQKPFDYENANIQQKDFAPKEEPKFKVGDWINGYYTNYKVLSVNNEGYVVEDVDGNKINILFENEKFHHLWTIQDAKDGDVLVGSKGDVILMFRGIGNTEWDDVIDYHCYYDCYREDFIVQKDVNYWGNTENNQLKPAAKEQRDLLFQKMKEAGYIFDFEKKEPKKIIDEKQIKKNLQDNSFRRMFEQKSTWSEEDEDYINDLIEYFSQNEKLKNTKEDIVIWVKSLKQRIGDKVMNKTYTTIEQNKKLAEILPPESYE